ncbi:MAG: hypothetical protein ACO3JL_14365 [Myxococcota bacterium]
MSRIGEHLSGRAFLNYLSGIHHDDAVARFGDDSEVVADEKDTHACLCAQAGKQRKNLRLYTDIECGGGLIRDEQ